MRTYTVTVTRIAADNATLTKLLLSDVMLPALDADMRTYMASVLNDLDDEMDGVQTRPRSRRRRCWALACSSSRRWTLTSTMDGHQVDLAVGDTSITHPGDGAGGGREQDVEGLHRHRHPRRVRRRHAEGPEPERA